MAYPLDVVTRTITVGDSLAVESGTGLTVRATPRPDDLDNDRPPLRLLLIDLGT